MAKLTTYVEAMEVYVEAMELYVSALPLIPDRASLRLRGAAPDLLAACEKLLAQLTAFQYEEAVCDHTVGMCFCSYRDVMERARQAIAKAKG